MMGNKGKGIAICLSLAICVFAAVLSVGGTAYGNTDIEATFDGLYGTVSTPLSDCITCHTSPPTFNSYGQAIDDAGGRAADAGSAAIQAVEGDDSDGDGFTNIDEITALTFPGDNTSFPAQAGDNTAPTVTDLFPADNAVNRPINTLVMATFSEAIDNTTVNDNSFILTDALDNVVAGTISVSTDNTKVTFTPDAFLDNNATYTATLTTEVTDLAGNPLADNVVWSFTTGAGITDIAGPTVLSTVPEDQAIDVAVTSAISATFDESIDPASVDNTSFVVTDGVNDVVGTIVVSGNTATFTPTASLADNTVYTATLTTAVTDLAENPLEADHTWTFTTAAAPPPVSGGGGGGGCSVAGAGSGWGGGSAIALLTLLAVFAGRKRRNGKAGR